jgi:aminomethyltransferase
VVNASNREKILAWLEKHLADFSGDVEMSDRTCDTAMIAVQGPQSASILESLVEVELDKLGYYCGVVSEHLGRPCTITRTGYTGENGFELIVRAEDALDTWKNIFRAGRDAGVTATGLGARDTLRLEAAMPLYGHELSEQVNPYQAGLGFAVNLKDREFVGRRALVEFKSDENQLKRIGLRMAGRRVPREHFAVVADGRNVGEVTSGTFSPTLQQPIAMAYVQPSVASIDGELSVEIRGRCEPAQVVELPFYRRAR